jgi:predicted MFS family arabinose efflux permease
VVNRPEELGQHPDGSVSRDAVSETAARESRAPTRRFLADRDFWIIALACGLLLGAPMLNGVYLVRHMEQSGISRQSAAFVMTWMAAFGVVGKLLVAALADRIDKRALVWGLVAVQLGSWALILAPPDLGTMLVAGVGFGLGIGGFVPLPAVFVGAWFGRAAFGQVAGLMSPIRLPITLSIVPAGGWLADQSGAHTATFVAAMAAAAVGALLLLFLRAPGGRDPAG